VGYRSQSAGQQQYLIGQIKAGQHRIFHAALQPRQFHQSVEQGADGLTCCRNMEHQRVTGGTGHLLAVGFYQQQQGMHRLAQIVAGCGQKL